MDFKTMKLALIHIPASTSYNVGAKDTPYTIQWDFSVSPQEFHSYDTNGKRLVTRYMVPTIDKDDAHEFYLHREDGPAVEYISGEWFWWKYGRMHNSTGPAGYHSDTNKHSWAFYGISAPGFLKWAEEVGIDAFNITDIDLMVICAKYNIEPFIIEPVHS